MAVKSGIPIVRLAELEIDPAEIDLYKTSLRAEIEASIGTEPSVRALYAVSVKDHPERVRIFEIYADQEAYESHPRSAHFLDYKMRTKDMIRSLNLIDTDPIVLCAKADDGLALRLSDSRNQADRIAMTCLMKQQ